MITTKKTKNLITIILAFLAALFITAAAGCNLTNKYTVQGRVLVDGVPVSNVTVSCGSTETTTDKNGKYTLKGLQGEVSVKFSSNKYWFPNKEYNFDKKSICDSTDGKKYRKIFGVCKNGNENVGGVRIEVSDDVSRLVVFSDSQGKFTLYNIVGDAEIKATLNGESLYSKKSFYDKGRDESVTIVSYSTFNLGFNLKDGLSEADFTAIYGDETYEISDKSGLFIERAEFGKSVTLLSDEYGFSETPVTVTEENQVKTVDVYKKYALSATVTCGSEPLGGASVYVDGTLKTFTDAKGKFTVNGLFGENVIKVEKDGFTSVTVTSNKDEAEFDFNLKKRIYGSVICDGKPLKNATVKLSKTGLYSGVTESGKDNNENASEICVTDVNGYYEFYANNGEEVEVVYNGVRFEKSIYSVSGETARYDFYGERFYDVEITLTTDDGEDFAVKLDKDSGNIYVDFASELVGGDIFGSSKAFVKNVYGERKVALLADGYEVEILGGKDKSASTAINTPEIESENSSNENFAMKNSVVVDYAANEISFALKKKYSVECSVVSDNITLSGAALTVNGTTIARGENGKYVLTLIKGDVIEAACDGYDLKSIIFDGDVSNVSILNLTYGLSVNVICGIKEVKDYSLILNGVKYSTENTLSGKTQIKGLSGSVTVKIEKEGYTFNINDTGDILITVQRGEDLSVTATYEVSVGVSVGNKALPNVKILMFDNYFDKEPIVATTDETGKVNFSGLDSVYTVIAEDYEGVRFKPDFLIVEEGGDYSFADSGYLVTIKTAVGGKVLPGVNVTYGGRTFTTGDSGEYRISLSETTEISVDKKGYDFDETAVTVSAADDGKTFVFNATYSVYGEVKSGKTPIVGVKVSVGENYVITDGEGKYVISGINSLDAEITFGKEGFIPEKLEVSGYAEVNASIYADVKFEVKCGETLLEDVKFNVNNEQKSKFSLDDTVEFIKDGYEFTPVTVTEDILGTLVAVNGSYYITGIVRNGKYVVSGASVLIGEAVKAATDENGEFAICGLVGTNVLTFELDGYAIETVEVSSPKNVVAAATYSVTIKVVCKDDALQNVTVKIGGENKGVTDSNGELTVSGLTGDNYVELYLDGYDFVGNGAVASPKTLNFAAAYTVSGKVGIGIDGGAVGKVKVLVNGVATAFTDDKGEFKLSGLDGENIITFEKHGYEIEALTVSSPVDKRVKASYYVETVFSGDFIGAVAFIGEERIAITDSLVNFGPFDGNVTIRFEKDGYVFNPSVIEAREYSERAVTISKTFTVSGKITTASGLPVIDITVTSGDVSVKTSTDGSYVLKGLSGSVHVKCMYEFIVDGVNLYNHRCEVFGSATYSQETEGVNLTVNDEEYAWAIFERNYLVKLGKHGDTAYSVKGTGDVTATAGVKTYGGFIKIKDANGNVLTENSNYGNSMFGIDPRVAVLSYRKFGSADLTYTQINGGKVTGANVADYSSATFNDVTEAAYTEKYGGTIDDILIYNIDSSTVDTIGLTVTDSGCTVSMNLKTTENMYSAYKKQIKEMSDVTIKSFEYVKLTLNFNEKGMVTNVKVEEKYTVTTMNATSQAVFNYDYSYDNVKDLSGFKKDNAVIGELLGR